VGGSLGVIAKARVAVVAAARAESHTAVAQAADGKNRFPPAVRVQTGISLAGWPPADLRNRRAPGRQGAYQDLVGLVGPIGRAGGGCFRIIVCGRPAALGSGSPRSGGGLLRGLPPP